MKQQDKELLLKDLCARLPYGVKAEKYTIRMDGEFVPLASIEIVTAKDIIAQDEYPGYTMKPYLFPLSSMTEEQKKKYESLCIKKSSECTDLYDIIFPKDYYDTVESVDYLYKKHIDIRGLIPMGLATDATNLNIY